MFRSKMDLRIKLATLPFTHFPFYSTNFVSEITNKKSTVEFRSYLNQFIEKLIPYLNQTERIEQFDEIALLTEKFFSYKQLMNCTNFGKNPQKFYMDRLKQISNLFITHRNGKLALKYWESSEEKLNTNSIFSAYSGIHKVALWNSLDRMMCTDIVAIYYMISNGIENEESLISYNTLIYLPDTQLEKVLEKGMAETHLHFSASGHFSLIWQALMSPVKRAEIERTTYVEKMTGKNRGIQLYVLAMASIRLLMASYLNRKIEKFKFDNNYGFSNFIQELNQSVLDEKYQIFDLIRYILSGSNILDSTYDVQKLYEIFEEVKFLTGNLIYHSEYHKESLLFNKTNTNDILSSVFGINKDYTSLENIFLFRALRHINELEKEDLFTSLFWKYIQVKNQKFSSAIQRNHVRGLSYFLNYFANATDSTISNNELERWIFLLRHQLRNSNMQKLEIRIAPSNASTIQGIKKGIVEKLLYFFKAYKEILKESENQDKDNIVSQVGIVIHFIKKKDEANQEKCWFDYNQSERNGERLSYKKNQLKYKNEMIAVREIREEIIGLADYIVGIDAANLESITEPWVFAPIFREARNSNTHQLVYKNMPNKKIRNLGLTYHAGEDFRHMLTGLRHIDEAIEHFQMRAGDRIGHGMVLGIDIKKWSLRNRVIILPRIEYLENLLWTWGACRKNLTVEIDIGSLEHKILRIAETIYQSTNGLSVYLLWKVYQGKFSEEIGNSLSKVKENDKEDWFCERFEKGQIWNEAKLASTYHCKCYLVIMQEPIEIEITAEEEVLIKNMQKSVINRVSREGIVIETNPTSNTAIGEIEHIFEHYIHNLNRKGLSDRKELEQNLIVTINTDDPLVFNTNIDNEFAYIFYSLQEKGYAREEILKWIDQIRENGINSSFIPTKNASFAVTQENIDFMIKRIKEYLYG